jgi:hypothetical protein
MGVAEMDGVSQQIETIVVSFPELTNENDQQDRQIVAPSTTTSLEHPLAGDLVTYSIVKAREFFDSFSRLSPQDS